MTSSHWQLNSEALRPKTTLGTRLLQTTAIVAFLLQLSPATSILQGETAGAASNGLSIGNVQAAGTVERFDKLEIAFHIANSVATAIQWPYDPAPPNGIPIGVGISVHAVFTDPDGKQFVQPAFPYGHFLDETRNGRDWHLPTGNLSWRVRFSPNKTGAWSYKLRAQDASGATETASFAFTVAPSPRRGFIRVSSADSRYFEFDDGTLFTGLGHQLRTHLDDPATKAGPVYSTTGNFGVNFLRLWLSSIFGSAWNPYIGGRNIYGGYLPRTGLVPFHDAASGETNLTLRIDYETDGDTGWFDACRFQFWDDPESVKPNTTYRLKVRYRGLGITGPRQTQSPNYGFVAKLGGWYSKCYEPGAGLPITNYGLNNDSWGEIEGTWYSGNSNYLPRLHMGLENVRQGIVHVQSVSLREDLGGGRLGPEMMVKPSMAHELYIPEEKAYAFDKIVANAERNGIYLKVVVMDKNDKIYLKMADDGSWATSDNTNGFYGTGRTVNKTRWLQQVWWRYLQARWGYSTSIHSWELTNEGNPSLTRHYQHADEFGKFMNCRVFGNEPGTGDGAKCDLNHPNRHMVTTSFWQWFPNAEFWSNAKYPNLDYADVHAYVSTSFAPLGEKELMQWDAAYYHTWHSQYMAGLKVGKPIVRGEAGLDAPNQQNENVLGVEKDTTGVWLHNFLWSTLHSGGLYEVYWWQEHLWSESGDRRWQYRSFANFVNDIPLNKGGFVDWGGSVSNPELRVVGQKNTATDSLHLWVQNRQHTWKNVVDLKSIVAASGQIIVPGFKAGSTHTLERWDTWTAGGQIVSRETLVADLTGNLRIPVSSLKTDLALKIRGQAAALPKAPTNVRVVP